LLARAVGLSAVTISTTTVDQKGKTNMHNIKTFLAPGIGLLSVAMFAAPASASDTKGNFALHGVGAQTCQVMLQELQPAAAAAPVAAVPAAAPAAAAAASPAASPVATASPPAAAPAAASMRPILTSWIMGYLTASDRMTKDTFDGTPVMAPEALTTMILGVCQRYPDARVESVASNVLNQLATARVLHDSPVMEARAGDRMVLIRKATLVAVQNSLVKSKLLKDGADGTFGNATVAALKTFQESQKLPVTGLPDPSTVVRLLVEMPAKVPAKG